MPNTEFLTKTEILAELWMNYRNDSEFDDFIEYNDLGLPLSYAVANGLVKPEASGKQMIEETFSVLLSSLGIAEDTGFEALDDVLDLEPPTMLPE